MSEELLDTNIRNALKERISKIENKQFTLLYKASRDGCSLVQFQKRCLDKGPTLLVLYGKDDTVFGGYTSKSWILGDHVATYDREAFLFYCLYGKATTFLEMEQSDYDHAITCHYEYGPSFGGGRNHLTRTFSRFAYDLQVFRDRQKINQKDGCFELNGKRNFNCIYKAQEAGFDAYSINGGTLTVKDLEVYEVEALDFFNDTKEVFEKRIEDSCLHSHVKCFNILMVGLVGAGKTSFCKTVNIASTNDTRNFAGPTAQQGESVTSKAIKVLVRRNDACKIQMLDVIGIEDGRTYEDELELLLKGKLIDGYRFPDKYEQLSTLVDDCNMNSDRIIHTLCGVIDATKFEVQSQKTLQNVKNVFKKAYEQGRQVSIIVTHVDKLCEYVHRSLDNIKRSVRAQNIMVKISHTLGVEIKNVFPVINYTDEESIDEVKDMLALRALAKIVIRAREFVDQNIGHIRIDCIRAKLKAVEENGLNILCVGRVNVGKSFFIDSIMSTLEKNIINTASGGLNPGASPHTKQLRRHTLGISDDQNQYHSTNVHLYDMPGFSSENKIDLEQIEQIVEGHCAVGFEFKASVNEGMSENVKTPEWLNRIHSVCFILDNESLDKPVEEKDMIHNVISRVLTPKGIPYIVVVTKLDKLRERELSRDEVIKKTANSFGLISGKIHAVQNYVDEKQTEDAIDIPITGCMEAIMNMGFSYYQKYILSAMGR